MSSSLERLQRKQFDLFEDLKNLSETDVLLTKISRYLELITKLDPTICPEIGSGKLSKF